ncbi:MAG: DDE-type integrase/transposase/recombinase [Candidatus Thiodiazotropha taylori]|nr:DDE-type integrase/transposase/recombinase [Candidatus Thiodiazotropha taylori]
MELDPETKHKSAFVTHEGVYQFTRMPFGLRNAPMSFQMLMSQVLKGLNWKFVLCYIDDILVFSSNFKEHLKHLNEVFQRLREAKLTLKPSKCSFAVEKVVYLGHVISKDGVSVDIEKTERVRSFPTPTTQRQLKSFLGLCNYYRRFVKDYSKICIPLNKLLKKEKKHKFAPGDWNTECENSFQTLKYALTSPPILGYPDMNLPFILSTDSSGSAIGYILGQKDKNGREFVVAYGGRALRPDEKKWTVTEQECLAVIVGIETYKHYLLHNKFTVYTDHKALQWLGNIKDPTGRLGRWAMKLQGINFEIIHRQGNRNQNADALSRRPYEKEDLEVSEAPPTKTTAATAFLTPDAVSSDISDTDLHPCVLSEADHLATTEHNEDCSQKTLIEVNFEYNQSPEVDALEPEVNNPNPEQEPDMTELQLNSSDFKDILLYLKDRVLPDDEKHAKFITSEANQYVLKDGILYHIFQPRLKHKVKDDPDQLILQLALPEVKRPDVLKAYHDCLAGGGHFGITRTFGAIRLKYWWPKMYQMIQDYIHNCDICQRIKVDRRRHPAPLHPLPIEETFSRVHIDILCSLPKTKEGYQYILVVVDSFSKWCESFPMRTQEATEVASILYNEIFTRFGAPRTIVSDRGRNFMSKLVKALCEMFQITRHYTSSYHPQTNATVERVNSTLTQTLRAYVNKEQSNWPSLLPSIMMAFRSSPCTESHQFTPFHLLFGKEMNLPIDTALIPKPSLGQNARQYFEELIQKLKVSQEIATKNMEAAKDQAKIRHDIKAEVPTFKRNDVVLLRTKRTEEGLSAKLSDKYTGPFYIVDIGPNHTYQLRNCADHKLLPSLIHANRIKLYNQHPNELIPVPDVRNPPPREEPLPHAEDTHPRRPVEQNPDKDTQPRRPSEQDQIQPTGTEPQAQDHDQSTYFPFERLLRVRKINGKPHFLVKWKDGSPNTWEPEENLSDVALREYYSTHTKSGRKRKRKQFKYFNQSQQ